MYSNEQDVLEQLRSIGLLVDLPLRLASGKPIRCRVDGGDHENRGWYRLHDWMLDSGEVLLVGSYGIWHGDDPGTRLVELTKRCESCGHDGIPLKAKTCPACNQKTFKSRELTQEQLAAMKKRQAEDKKRADAERKAEIAQAAQWASAVWRKCEEIEPRGHGYLVKKKLAGTGGARVFRSNDGINLAGAEKEDYEYLARFHGALVVPMCDSTGAVFGLQFILDRQIHKERIERTGRDKDYWPAGLSKDGHYWMIGGLPGRVCLEAEGFATAMSLHEASGLPVAVAFDAGNLPKVAQAIKATHKRTRQLICADDDWLQKCGECKQWTPVSGETCAHCGQPHKKQNAGKARASEAALAVDGAWVAPVFAEDRPTDRKGPTDFNDLHELEGIQAVRAQIEAKLAAMGIDTATAAPVAPPAGGGSRKQGGGERRKACSIMAVDDAVERFIPLDDGTGKYLFDTWTNKVVLREQMLTLLPAGTRGDDIKRHPLWISRGAYYLHEVGFDPAGNDEDVQLNTWKGWPMKPKAGKCEAILELLQYLCSGDDRGEEVFRWLLCWMAYPLQHPGAKMNSAIIMHGPQGTGKSVVFQTLAKIYGDYSTVLNQRGLEDKFNSDWADSKLFILAEEVVTRAEMWHIKNELKELVTGEWIRVNPKNVAAYRQRNHVNIVYLSNENQPLPIENDDRRHLVIWTPWALSEGFYDNVVEELENGGTEAFYDHLLKLDLSGFHPKKRPPMTEAKKSLIALSLPSEIRFVQEWILGDLGIPIVPCRAEHLYAAYIKWCRENGETRPRPSNQFHVAVARQKGWEKKKTRAYLTDTATSSTPVPIVIPPPDVLSAAGTAMKEGGSQAQWLGECIRQFAQALGIDTERLCA